MLAFQAPTERALFDMMSLRDINDWIIYYGLEPWGEERADLRAGIISHVVANCNRGKGTKSFKPSDFMPDFVGDSKKQTPDQMWSQAQAMSEAYAAATGAEVIRE